MFKLNKSKSAHLKWLIMYKSLLALALTLKLCYVSIKGILSAANPCNPSSISFANILHTCNLLLTYGPLVIAAVLCITLSCLFMCFIMGHFVFGHFVGYKVGGEGGVSAVSCQNRC